MPQITADPTVVAHHSSLPRAVHCAIATAGTATGAAVLLPSSGSGVTVVFGALLCGLVAMRFKKCDVIGRRGYTREASRMVYAIMYLGLATHLIIYLAAGRAAGSPVHGRGFLLSGCIALVLIRVLAGLDRHGDTALDQGFAVDGCGGGVDDLAAVGPDACSGGAALPQQ